MTTTLYDSTDPSTATDDMRYSTLQQSDHQYEEADTVVPVNSDYLYPSHTGAATVLRLHCDQFLDQIALDRSKVALWSQYGRRVVVVGRTSRRVVAVAILVAVRNFRMFKILYCDFLISIQSVCTHKRREKEFKYLE